MPQFISRRLTARSSTGDWSQQGRSTRSTQGTTWKVSATALPGTQQFKVRACSTT